MFALAIMVTGLILFVAVRNASVPEAPTPTLPTAVPAAAPVITPPLEPPPPASDIQPLGAPTSDLPKGAAEPIAEPTPALAQ